MRHAVRSLSRFSLLGLLAVFCVACAPQAPKAVQRESLQTVTATVEAIDLPSRMVVLRGDRNVTAALSVDPEVRNLEQVQPGDRVVVSYYEALAAQVKKPGKKSNDGMVREEIRARPGERPGRSVEQEITTTVAIESVDTSFNTVSFRRADGIARTVAIETPEGRAFIRKLRPGDQVEVTYTEAVAVQVKPAG